jgi:hypothetical protein
LAQHDLALLVQDVTDVKPPAIAYVDDRAVRFEGNYGQVMAAIEVDPWWAEAKKREVTKPDPI